MFPLRRPHQGPRLDVVAIHAGRRAADVEILTLVFGAVASNASLELRPCRCLFGRVGAAVEVLEPSVVVDQQQDGGRENAQGLLALLELVPQQHGSQVVLASELDF